MILEPLATDAQQPLLRTAAEITLGMQDVAAAHGFRTVLQHEFPRVSEMAARLMCHEVAAPATFRAVQSIQPSSSLCFCEAGVITGMLGVLLLRETAVGPLKSGRFDGVEVDLDLLARRDEAPMIGYGWGMAASTKPAGAAIIAVTMPLRTGPLAALTFVTKAVTGVGRHVSITRFGYRPLRGPDDDLLISDPTFARSAA